MKSEYFPDRFTEGYEAYLNGDANYCCEMESWGEFQREAFTKGYERAKFLCTYNAE